MYPTASAVVGSVIKYDGTSSPMNSGASITWTIGAIVPSDYTFTGPDSTTQNDPVLYLMRGLTYYFVNNSGGGHPID